MASSPVPLNFDSIPGHQVHEPTIGPAPKTTAGEVLSNVANIPIDPIGEIGKGLDALREKLMDSEHPAAKEVGQKLTDAKELLFGGQAAGKPLGTSEGVVNNPVTSTIAAVPGSEETLAKAEELAKEYGPKVLEHLAETGKNFLESGKAEVRSALHAHAPEGRISEAGRVPLNFDDIPGHELKKAPEPPKNEQVAASAQRYNASRGRQAIDHSPVPLPPPEEKAALADAYDAARHEPENPKVQAAYQAMKDETKAQFDHVQNDLGIKVDFTDKDPYHSAQEMQRDVRDNHHLSVFTGGEVPKDHPLAEVEPQTGQSYNNLFRATHDVFGHAAGGHDFSEAGENSAYGAHTQMYSPEAQPAVKTETQGQSNWFFNNREVRNGKVPGDFAEQKATILPEAEKSTNGDIAESQQAATSEPTQVNPAVPEQANSAPATHPDLQKVIDKFGTSENGVGVRRGASFITPDGKFIHVNDHPAALKASGLNSDAHDARVQFGNDTQTVRMRFRPNTKAGDELSVTVPAQGATDKQVQGIKDAINSSMPRGTGNLVIERYDVNAGNINQYSKTIENVKPYMVDQALKDIHAHPDGDWIQNTIAKMGSSPAGAIDPRTGKEDTEGFGVEAFTEARKAQKPLDHFPTEDDIQKFYDTNKQTFDKHPELRLGWDHTDKGWELNIGIAAKTQAGAEVLGRQLDQRAIWDIANKKEIPTGGQGVKTRFSKYKLADRIDDAMGRNVAKLPASVRDSQHITEYEKHLLGSDSTALKDLLQARKRIAKVQELAETARAGEANRFWYERAKKTFDAMFDSLPQGSFPEADRNRFIRLVAATSPRVDVQENVDSALSAYKAWTDAGRPTDPARIREAVDSSLMMPGSHGPNAVRALTDKELSGPKVSSFGPNFMGDGQHVTNDMWGGITNGIVDGKELSKPGTYIALSENYRKTAEALNWLPKQAQAASWGFIRTLGNMSGLGGKLAGADKPATEVLKLMDDDAVRKYSADIADIFLNSAKVRDRLESLGINLEEFDARLTESIKDFGRERKAGSLDTGLLAKSARRIGKAKAFVKEQRLAGKEVNQKASGPMLGDVLSGEREPGEE